MRYSEKWGDNIDSAVELALKDLKLTLDQVNVTVLEQPSRGFFGIGSKLAKVRVEEIEVKKETPAPEKAEKAVKAEKSEKAEKPEKKVTYEGNKEICIEVCGVEGEETEEAEKPAAAPSRKERNRSKNKSRKQREKKPAVDLEEGEMPEEIKVLVEKPADLVDDPENPAKVFLESVVKEMGLNVNVKVSKNAECVYCEIEGPDTGTIIGKRGATLDAIQYLTSLVVNKEKPGYTRVIVDAENYREKREKTLEKLAYRLADKAVRTGKTVRLEPMNPYERKVIHTALQRRPEVTTRSEGEEPYRRVIIEASK